MLLAQDIGNEQEAGKLPKDLEYGILRYVDDYRIFCNDRDALDRISYMLQHILERFNFRMNPSKTRTSNELIADSIKPDKAFYIFNTPIESKQTLKMKRGMNARNQAMILTDSRNIFCLYMSFLNAFLIRDNSSHNLRRLASESKISYLQRL